jgi:lipoyl(octanoyl) transferase
MADFNYRDLGTLDYKECWDLQETLLAEIVDDKLSRREPSGKNFFLLVEHPHVYTLGKSGNEKNLFANENFFKKTDAAYYKINRGGDITYHGPGQIVGYPIIDLEFYNTGVHKYIENIEEAIIGTLGEFGITADRKEGATGVWIDAGNPLLARKICAIGVRVSRYVTMHGFALNVNTDMQYFQYINPCGLNLGVTSVNKELEKDIPIEEVKEILKRKFNEIF